MQNSYSRESRFSNRVLEAYARAGLPETFTVRAAANDNPTEILLYSEIGPWGVTAKDFVRVLAQVGDGPITLRINSPRRRRVRRLCYLQRSEGALRACQCRDRRDCRFGCEFYRDGRRHDRIARSLHVDDP
jgi:hypothetical protein